MIAHRFQMQLVNHVGREVVGVALGDTAFQPARKTPLGLGTGGRCRDRKLSHSGRWIRKVFELMELARDVLCEDGTARSRMPLQAFSQART